MIAQKRPPVLARRSRAKWLARGKIVARDSTLNKRLSERKVSGPTERR
jgi:hypothetical protein